MSLIGSSAYSHSHMVVFGRRSRPPSLGLPNQSSKSEYVTTDTLFLMEAVMTWTGSREGDREKRRGRTVQDEEVVGGDLKMKGTNCPDLLLSIVASKGVDFRATMVGIFGTSFEGPNGNALVEQWVMAIIGISPTIKERGS